MEWQGSKKHGTTARPQAVVRHYSQSTDFTCGPSALLMAMNAQHQGVELDRTEELQIWREANTIFMGSRDAQAGCSALGLALAAHARGFETEVYLSHRTPLLATKSRGKAQREVTSLIHARDLATARGAGIPIFYQGLELQDLDRHLARGLVPVVLITCWYFDRSHAPHWVVITGVGEREVLLNDPWVYEDRGETGRDRTNLAVPHGTFEKMIRYGSRREQAMVLIGRRRCS